MNRSRLTAKELRRRYRQGERNFANADLSGESLRGMNLQDINLSGADLNQTDLRGTNLTHATLVGTQLIASTAGTRRRWLILQLLIALTLVVLGSLLIGTVWGELAAAITNPDGSTTETVFGDRLFGILGIGFYISFLALIYNRGLLASLGLALGAFVFAFIIAVAIAIAGAFTSTVNGASGLGVALGVAIGVAIAIAGAIAGAGAVAFAGTGAGTSTGVVAGAFATVGAFATAGADASAVALLNTIVYFLITKRALKGDSRDQFIRTITVWFTSWGGTKLIGADLTNADLSKATLKSAHLYRAQLTRTQFHLAQKVNLARLGKTILANFAVQNLLITQRGSRQSYAGLNLKGANLVGADLADADFTEADLSQATLEEATLERANLTKTQALGTRFHQTILTGATLEAWNIDSTTYLDGAICDYVYLLRDYQERRPSSGIFAPGEFTKLFQEVLNTIDLIFRNGVDWKAFIQTLQQVQIKYDNANLSVQGIENKGDGVVVVKLNTAHGADKPSIHQSFTKIYQLAFKEAESQYKSQLNAKDSEIQIYRQQSADVMEILKRQAQRPIITEIKTVQGNDYSQRNQYGHNANIVNQYGDGNTAQQELKQVALPPPESVNIQANLLALQGILASLNDPVTNGIAQKLEAEAQKPNPDKSVVSQTLETGLTYAKNLHGFAEAMDQLRPHVQNAAGWLGQHGYKLLPLVGLVAL